jgi:DEAD/DEAH box helicase domain-containing protein
VVDLEDLVRAAGGRGQLVHLEHIPARPARTADPCAPRPRAVAGVVPRDGLWCHQAAAVDRARAGRSVAIATGTASGKSLSYQLPIAEAVLDSATALLVYPTKALAQDQLRALLAHQPTGMVATTYDGDTPLDDRARARREANVVLTNPEMLHVGILPNHQRWAGFLGGLRYVVLDELHMLRGVFGTHVSHVLRRLRRICASYGSHPTFILCSATIGAPGQLAAELCGLPVEEVTEDGSPRGERLFALWRPPLLDPDAGARASANVEAAELLVALVTQGFRCIVFTRSRKTAEVVAAVARSRLPEEVAGSVRAYRGGYLAAERRQVEAELFGGRLRGVVATSALELGVDVGGLDACVLDGFPGTIASMWQRAGRAGRARQRSLAVLVAGEDALDQWLMAHPHEVFTRPPEPAVVNPSNPFILDSHLACAAYELPLTPGDESWWDAEDLEDGIRRLVLGDRLRVRAGRACFAGSAGPAPGVGLRTAWSASEYQIVDGSGEPIGTVDEARAFTTVHPGAIYLHQGQHYRVERLDLDERAAWVTPTGREETTQARSETRITILTEEERAEAGVAQLLLGAVEVTEQVTGYRRMSAFGREVLADEPLDLPPIVLTTRAFWYTVEPKLLAAAGITAASVPGALHAAEHAGIGILPLFAVCDRWDVGGVSTNFHPDSGLPSIFVYDGYPGGAGIAELGFTAGRRHLEATLQVIADCPCEAGCPSCVQSPKCGNLNEPLDKAGAAALLRAVLGSETGVSSSGLRRLSRSPLARAAAPPTGTRAMRAR